MSDISDIALGERTPDETRAEIHIAVDTLRALYYLAQAINSDNRKHLALLRRLANTAHTQDLPRLLSDVKRDVVHLKRESGCRLSDDALREIYASMNSKGGATYRSTISIDTGLPTIRGSSLAGPMSRFMRWSCSMATHSETHLTPCGSRKQCYSTTCEPFGRQ